MSTPQRVRAVIVQPGHSNFLVRNWEPGSKLTRRLLDLPRDLVRRVYEPAET